MSDWVNRAWKELWQLRNASSADFPGPGHCIIVSGVQTMGEKSSEDSDARLVCSSRVCFHVGVALARLLGFRTRATSVGGPSIEPQVICRAKSKHRLRYSWTSQL